MNPAPPQTASTYEVWAVLTREALPLCIAGFLIADRSRMPALIAWIEGSGDLEMLTAKRIAEARRSPEIATADLRGRAIPSYIVGKPLLLLDLADAGTGAGVCGAFTRYGAVVTFSVIMRQGVAAIARPIAEKVHAADEQAEKGTR
jgi:hypothetical protein